MADPDSYTGWAIVEFMGHRRLAGLVGVGKVGGTSFIRIDVPGEDGSGGVSQFYAPASLYCLTPTTEEIARAVARSARPQPVQRWELPSAREDETDTEVVVAPFGDEDLADDDEPLDEAEAW